MPRSLSIQDLQANLIDPLKSSFWELFIPNMIGGGDVDAVRLRCHTSAAPSVSSDDIAVDWRAMRFMIAGKLNFSHTIAISFLESSDAKIIRAFYNWRQYITNHETGLGEIPSVYKTDVYLALLNTKAEVAIQYQLIGCYPKEVQEIALDMSANAIISQPIVLSYDRWKLVDSSGSPI